jgi:mannose-6-phosphate isomerase-like protein (cupin superfamily)
MGGDANMEKIVEKTWGSEEWIVNNEIYCGKILNLNKNYRCSLHYHKNKDEHFYILTGLVKMELEGKIFIMNPGDDIHIFPGKKHWFTGIKNSKIIEFSTHHFLTGYRVIQICSQYYNY